MSKFDDFAKLHVAGDPLVLFNVWDAGSAAAVAKAGAKATATGSASVAMANGFGDGQEMPLELALANAERVAGAVELPVTIDFEGGYAEDFRELTDHGRRLAMTGAIGCNFEDQVVGTNLIHETTGQCRRIEALRAGVGNTFFINARTDIFLKAPLETHDAAMVDAALERARAYADAGASGFFVPMLADLKLFERVCRESPLPVNFMAFPGCPSKAEVAAAGAARISHGPFPHMALMKKLEEMAREAIG